MMQLFPMIQVDLDPADHSNFQHQCEKLIKRHRRKMDGPEGQIAFWILQGAFVATKAGKMTHDEFWDMTIYTAAISNIPIEIMCAHLAMILVSRGEAFNGSNHLSDQVGDEEGGGHEGLPLGKVSLNSWC